VTDALNFISKRTAHKERHNLYPPPNNVEAIKSKRMKLVGHVARMGEIRTVFCKILIYKLI
jgi:hypothetical protein